MPIIDRLEIKSAPRWVHLEEIPNSENPIDRRCASLICFYCLREASDVYSSGKIWHEPRGEGEAHVCVRVRYSPAGGKFNIPKLHSFDRALYRGAVNRAVEGLIRRINIGLINLMSPRIPSLLACGRKLFHRCGRYRRNNSSINSTKLRIPKGTISLSKRLNVTNSSRVARRCLRIQRREKKNRWLLPRNRE